MNKKILVTMLGGAMAMSLTGCGNLKSPTETTSKDTQNKTEAASTNDGGSSAVTPEITLVYAEVNPLDTIVGQTGTAFKEKVEELSGGKIKIDIQASGVLGAENDVLDTMLGGGGTIDMARISAFALTSYGGKNLNYSLSHTHLEAVTISGILQHQI